MDLVSLLIGDHSPTPFAGQTKSFGNEPPLILADGPNGIRSNYKVYCFPCPLLLASSWNPSVLKETGIKLANQAKTFGVDIILSPGINIIRHPFCGRNFEYYSEDPYVSGFLGSFMVKGIQENGIGACVKHFAVYNQETDRKKVNIQISQEALFTVYLKSFEILLQLCKPICLMTSYNKLNGTYTSENKWLLQDILRNKFNYNGLIITDWDSGSDPLKQIISGVDIVMPGHLNQEKYIKDKLKTESDYTPIIHTRVNSLINTINAIDSIKHLYIQSRLKEIELTDESIILLQNDNHHLPILSSTRIALFGNHSYSIIEQGDGSAHVNSSFTISLDNALEKHIIRIDSGLKEYYKKYDPTVEPLVDENYIQYTSDRNDMAIITIGRTSGEFEDNDIQALNLSEIERKMIQTISRIYRSKHKKILVVLNVGGPFETYNWKHMVDSIILCYYPGSEGCYSIARILLGLVTPSGKLTCTFPKTIDRNLYMNFYKSRSNIKENIYEEDIYVGYRNVSNTNISFPFGHGLSYTSFYLEWADHTIEGHKYSIRIKVTNTGHYKGKEVIQLYTYIHHRVFELKGFQKTSLLNPGESQLIVLEGQLDLIKGGNFYTLIGTSVRDIKIKKLFRHIY